MSAAVRRPSPEQVAKVIEGVVSVLSPDLLSPKYAADLLVDAHPTTGHCSVAAESVYFLLGGPTAGLIAMVARDHDGTTHWWLVHKPTGTIIDPTRAQYDTLGDCPPYERGIPGMACGFMGQRRNPASEWGFGRNPGKRAAEVLRRVGAAFPSLAPVSRTRARTRRSATPAKRVGLCRAGGVSAP